MPWRSTGRWDVLKGASRSCGHEPDNTHLVCLEREGVKDLRIADYEGREEAKASGTRLHVKATRTPWSCHSPSLPLGQDPRSLRKSGDPASPILADALSASEPTQSTRACLRACSSARADLEGGIVQPYAQKLVEALHSGGRHEPLGRRIYGYIGNPRLPLAACVARKALTHPRLEGVPSDPGPELAAQLNEHSPFLDSRVGVIHHYRTSCPQCGFYELPLPPVSVPIVAEQVLADVLVGGGEPLAEECALPRSLQADEDDQLHIHSHVHGSP